MSLEGLVCTDFSVIEMFFEIELPRFLISVTIIFRNFLIVFRQEENVKPQTFHLYNAWCSLTVSSRIGLYSFSVIEMFFKIELPHFLVSLTITSNKTFKRTSAAIKQ